MSHKFPGQLPPEVLDLICVQLCPHCQREDQGTWALTLKYDPWLDIKTLSLTCRALRRIAQGVLFHQAPSKPVVKTHELLGLLVTLIRRPDLASGVKSTLPFVIEGSSYASFSVACDTLTETLCRRNSCQLPLIWQNLANQTKTISTAFGDWSPILRSLLVSLTPNIETLHWCLDYKDSLLPVAYGQDVDQLIRIVPPRPVCSPDLSLLRYLHITPGRSTYILFSDVHSLGILQVTPNLRYLQLSAVTGWKPPATGRSLHFNSDNRAIQCSKSIDKWLPACTKLKSLVVEGESSGQDGSADFTILRQLLSCAYGKLTKFAYLVPCSSQRHAPESSHIQAPQIIKELQKTQTMLTHLYLDMRNQEDRPKVSVARIEDCSLLRTGFPHLEYLTIDQETFCYHCLSPPLMANRNGHSSQTLDQESMCLVNIVGPKIKELVLLSMYPELPHCNGMCTLGHHVHHGKLQNPERSLRKLNVHHLVDWLDDDIIDLDMHENMTSVREAFGDTDVEIRVVLRVRGAIEEVVGIY